MEERHQHTTTTGQEANRQTWTTRDHTAQATATSPGQGPDAATLLSGPADLKPQGSIDKIEIQKRFLAQRVAARLQGQPVPEEPYKNRKVRTLPSEFKFMVEDRYANFHKSGSIRGMKKLVYGQNALLVRCGSYIYNVTPNPVIYFQHAHD